MSQPATRVLSYLLDDAMTLASETVLRPGYSEAAARELIGRMRAGRTGCARRAAVLEQVRQARRGSGPLRPRRFSGRMASLVVRTAIEGNVEMTLTLRPGGGRA